VTHMLTSVLMTVVGSTFRVTDAGVRLLGARCPVCEAHSFPARAVCASCGERDQQVAELSGKGTVHATSLVATPPAGFDMPYLFAAVDLDEGPRTFAILTAPPTASGRVVAVSAPLRHDQPGFRFAPAP
jgi:uncharacterized OB-fold protein